METYLATLFIFLLFFVACGIGILITKKNFRGGGCNVDPHDTSSSCCKNQANCETPPADSKKENIKPA